MTKPLLRTGLLALAATLAGCAAEPYQRPEVSVPADWIGRAADAAQWPQAEWWKALGSEELDRLIAQALAGNHDLRAAAARVVQARAAAQVAGAARFPTVTLDASAVRDNPAGGKAANVVTVSPAAAYEIDVWGRNRQAYEAADSALLATDYARATIRLSLTAEVANAYLAILSLNDRLRVAQENLDNAERLMALIDAQLRAGKVSALEVERQRTQVAAAQAAIPVLLQQRRVTQDALAVLLGRNPGEIVGGATSLRPLAVPAVPLGLPAALLERRPDVRQAEAALMAAHADMAAARAALFPQLFLSASGGYTASAVSRLGDAGTGFSLVGASLLATIFDGGRRSGLADIAQARKEELLENYRRSLVSALREVEDALAGIDEFARQEAAQAQAAAHAREAYRLAHLRYREGGTDYGTVLDAQRTQIAAEAALDPVRFARFASAVGLYRALGGGWEAPARTSAAGG